MALGSEQMVGRAAELGVIDDALDQQAAGRFVALQVVGEPGIGKTRLLTELGARAEERGHLALAGSASELEHELPFWVFVDALDDYLQGLEPRRLEALGDETLARLGNVFPSLATAGDEVRDERYRTHKAVRRLLEHLSATKPLVLLFDDVHWADSGSVELLGSLFRRPSAARVLLAVAVRPRQLPERLSGTLERLHADGAAIRVELNALTAEEARELVGDAADPLYEQSGGNPFYLQQLARVRGPSSDGDGNSAGVALAGVEVPRTVAAALMEELALLPADTRRALEGAAVAGDPFEPELAAAIAGLSEEATVGALDELLRRDLVRPTDVPRRFRFRHPIVRGAVYEAAPGGWRLQAHERAAETLAMRGASATARAHHIERCARTGDAGAVAVLQEAAATVAHRAPATAARILGAAIRLLGADQAAERAELLGTRAQAQAAAGEWQPAYMTLTECLELLPDHSTEMRLRLTSACAGLENLLGLHQQAHTRLTTALGELADMTSPEGIGLMLELAVDGFYRMEYNSMWDWAGRALDAARPRGDRSLTAAAAGMATLAASFSGQTADAEAVCAEGAELVDSMADAELAPRIDWAIDTLAGSELYLDRTSEAGAHSDRAVALAEATGQANALPILFWAGLIRTGQGRLVEAAAILDTAIERARVANHSEGLVWNLFARSLAATAAGDAEPALALAEEAVELARPGGRTFPAMGAGVALAGALVGVDAHARATEVLLEAGGGDALPLAPACWRPASFEVLTRSLLGSDRRDDAARAAERALSLAGTLGTRTATASAERAVGAVALHAEDPQAAAGHALAAAEAAEGAGTPIEAALARLLAGRALAQADEKDRAVTELQNAAASFQACGALCRRDEAERELGRLGRRPHRRSRKGDAGATGLRSLSARELEVAQLIVDRKTNSQIAAELFLSPKTVETHIRHLFQKLGVSSRVEVARAVERAERAAH